MHRQCDSYEIKESFSSSATFNLDKYNQTAASERTHISLMHHCLGIVKRKTGVAAGEKDFSGLIAHAMFMHDYPMHDISNQKPLLPNSYHPTIYLVHPKERKLAEPSLNPSHPCSSRQQTKPRGHSVNPSLDLPAWYSPIYAASLP